MIGAEWLKEHGHMEWEILRSPLTLDGLVEHGPLPPGVRSVTLSRDEEYRITAEFEGYVAFPTEAASEILREGKSRRRARFIRGRDVVFEHAGVRTTLHGCHIARRNLTDSLEQGPTRVKVTGVLRTHGVSRRSGGDPASITEWYLNGPGGWFVYPRHTERAKKGEYKRARSEPSIERVRVEIDDLPNWAMDHFRIDHGDLRVVVQQVPGGLGPAWGSPVAVEYPAPSRQPDAEDRTKISEFLSFVLGRHLLKVGETHYDSSGQVVYEEATNPWGISPRATCGGRSYAPIDIEPFVRKDPIVERVSRELLPRYLERADELDLSSTLWRFWAASTTPLGVDIPAYYSAIQGLADRWAEKKPQKFYVPSGDFRALHAELVKTFDAGIDAAASSIADPERRRKTAERLRTNMGNINRMSFNESFASVFDLLCLPLGDTEEAAFKARHKSAHGGYSAGGPERLMILSTAYWSILARMILRMLDYEGEYQDLTQPEPAMRPLGSRSGRSIGSRMSWPNTGAGRH